MTDRSEMTKWRLEVVKARGSARLNQAVEAGEVSANAAFTAAQYLDRAEQDEALTEHPGTGAFSRAMAAVAREHTGRVRRDLTEDEWTLVQQMRREGPESD